DRKLVADKKLDLAAVQDAARDAAEAVPHVLRAYALHDLLAGCAGGEAGRVLADSANAQRTADVEVLLEPYWIFAARGTSPGSGYGYDTPVPVIFMGRGIRAGPFREPISVNDVAPTLADILGVETPSGSSGRVLDEILAVR